MSDAPVSTPAQGPVPAGFFRRATATFTDVFTGLLGAFLVLSLAGIFMPIDHPKMVYLARPVMFLGFLYVGVGLYLFPNSLGKYAFAVRVVSDRTGGQPTLRQCLVRWVPLIFWPVEAVVLLLSPSKKRIGDRLAGTSVYEDAATKARWGRRIGLSLTALFVFYLVLVHAMQAAARNTEMFQRAVSYVQENRVGEKSLGVPVALSATPIKVVMKEDKGEVIVSAEGPKGEGYIEMKMVREFGKWEVAGWGIADSPSGRGYSYNY
jgi:uncharacterized RDD family membrane protein YckC